MKQKIIPAVVLIAAVFLLFPRASSAEIYDYSVNGLAFKLHLKFSAPIKSGMDAYTFSYPDAPGTGGEKFEITLVFMDKDMIDSLNMTENEQYMYVKSVYFGTSDDADKKIERTFMGTKITGEYLECSIPRESTLELFIIPLKNGGKLAAGFKKYDLDKEASEKIIDEFANSLSEVL